MIVSASRRTDIPSFYMDWLVNRLQEGFVCSRNPMNPRQVGKIVLRPDIVDCIVFWSKNPLPALHLLPQVDQLGYPYYFQFTLNPYDQRLEKKLPPIDQRMETFHRLSDRIGPARVVWRYDPVILTSFFQIQEHLEAFNELSMRLKGYTDQCIFSFHDVYAKNRRQTHGLIQEEVTREDQIRLAEGFSRIAARNGMSLATCSENMDLTAWGIQAASCIDPQRIEKISGYPLQVGKDPNQRPACGCVESVDIGAYDSCPYQCVYCYATKSDTLVQRNMQRHQMRSPLLLGDLQPDDVIREREGRSFRQHQVSL